MKMSNLRGPSCLLAILVAFSWPVVGCVPNPAADPLADSDSGASDPSGAEVGDVPDAQTGEPSTPSKEALSNFSVVDVNPGSARYQEAVSPRDYLGQISAWYFGHST